MSKIIANVIRPIRTQYFTKVNKVVIVEAISFLFILLFMYAAVSKFADYDKFRIQLGQSPLLTDFAKWIAWFIPAVEVVISLMLAFARSRLKGLYASFTLMVMFTAYIFTIQNFSDYIPCSCGGILQDMSWTQHLLFNLAFVILGVVGIKLMSETESQ
jgi:Methylamine utilisation protein MauE.